MDVGIALRLLSDREFTGAYYVVLTFSPGTEATLSQHYGMPAPCGAVVRQGQAGGVFTPGQEGDRCFLVSGQHPFLHMAVRETDNPNANNIALYVYEEDDELGDPPKAGVLLAADGVRVLGAFDQTANRQFPRWAEAELLPDGSRLLGLQADRAPGARPAKHHRHHSSHHRRHPERYEETAPSGGGGGGGNGSSAEDARYRRWAVDFIIGVASSIAAALLVVHLMSKRN